MTQEQQQIAIAEACGWKLHSELDKTLCAPHQTDCPLVAELITIPDYPNDLNAMHEAEKALTGYQQTVTYSDNLIKIVGYHTFDSAHATAKQRAEAFLRTLNLWNE